MKILMCSPEYFDVTYSINPWMSVENGVDAKLAIKQWNDLVILLERVEAEVIQMSGKPNLPDLVFTANAGLNCGSHILLSNFKFPERQPEKQVYKEWFESNGYVCKELPDDIIFEGAGDVLLRNGVDSGFELYLGSGFRTDEATYDSAVWKSSVQTPINTKMKLIDPYFYHLDTCFCPLPGDFALIYPGAFETSKIEELNKRGKDDGTGFCGFRSAPILLKVPENEARKFACNAVSVGNCVVLPSGCPETGGMLKKAGFEVYETDLSQYILSGGSAKCLSFKLDSTQ